MKELESKKMKKDVSETMIAFTKATMDKFLKEEKPADLIALYSFYYYTSKWQASYNCKAVKKYCAEGLKISESRVATARAILLRMGLISAVERRDENGCITGHYTRVHFILKLDTEQKVIERINKNGLVISHTPVISQKVAPSTSGKTPPVVEKHTNAVGTNNLNAVDTSSLNAVGMNKSNRDELCLSCNTDIAQTTNPNPKPLVIEEQSRLTGSVYMKKEEKVIEPVQKSKNDEVIDYFVEGLTSLDKNFKLYPPARAAWSRDIDLMVKEGRTHDEIRKVIDFALKSEWWCSKITSMSAVRKHMTKLVIESKATVRPPGKFIVGYTRVDNDEYHKIPEADLRAYLSGKEQGKYNGTEYWEGPYIRQLAKSGITGKNISKEDK